MLCDRTNLYGWNIREMSTTETAGMRGDYDT